MHTIFEIKYELLRFFKDNNGFNIKKHYNQIDTGDVKDKDLKKALLYGALTNLCEQKVVKRVDTADDRWYILETPLEMNPQTIEVSHDISMMLAGTINAYCQGQNNNEDLCDPMNISGEDIYKLLVILQMSMTVEEPNED
jgi:hypothetical protein